MPHHNWADVTNSNGYNGYWPNPGVRTNSLLMPTTRPNRLGDRPIRIGTIYRDFASGPGSIWQGIFYQGVETLGEYLFPTSGGAFDFFIRGSAGTLQFGRCEPCGNTVQSENQVFSWNGMLAGALDYAQVSTEPWITHYQSGDKFYFTDWDVADNGGSGIINILREVSIDGGSYGGMTTGWGSTYNGEPGKSYRFRFTARNSVGDSEWWYTPVYWVEHSGGRRMTGAASSTPLTIARRRSGSTWVDLTTRKRHNGTSFVDISN